LQNVSLDFRDGLRARRQAVDHASLIEDHLLRRELAAQVRRAIRSLPPKQRAAVIMHKYLEMDYGRIAAELGCTTSAVKAMMFRAYEALRCELRHSERGQLLADRKRTKTPQLAAA
jgi:RNA polymerase sigma-70 factor (ECF subfamily)